MLTEPCASGKIKKDQKVIDDQRAAIYNKDTRYERLINIQPEDSIKK